MNQSIPCRHIKTWAGSVVALLWFASWAFADDHLGGQDDRPGGEQLRFFETTIRPLLADHCYQCHGPDEQESGLRVDTLSGLLAGGKAGPSLVPGKPAASLLITAVSYRDSQLQMPPEQKLSDRQIADLTRWIQIGAPHPEHGDSDPIETIDPVDNEPAVKHWAFQSPLDQDPTLVAASISESQVPATDHPIDTFITASLSRQGLRAVGVADKRTLIRRATFDLIGLPPTVAEIDSFLADDSADAFERVVDRLLGSPHYGQRWGRHWLDVARYADSNGLDENVAHGNAWRYRDYVIDSFNSDKPYDEFIVEQLAGDLLDWGTDLARRHEQLIATGFLVLGPKVLAEVDESKMQMDIIDEQIDTIGRSLMGLTLGCARCHAHKFDPISHDDYYALAGIFKSTCAMDSYTKIAKWHENSLELPDDTERKQQHQRLVAEKKRQIEDSPQAPDALHQLREQLKQLELSAPSMPSAMGVVDGPVTNAAIHLRGSHLTLGDTVPRRFPVALAGGTQPPLPEDSSGRLELARWLTSGEHPLTARVMVNRIWRGHFGKGLVKTVDNFGLQGDPPTHPQLLDFLAVRLVDHGWSIKAMHRLIMSSATYQRSSEFDEPNSSIDPGNRFYWRYDVRRLEAEPIRDALLAVSGRLERTFGGSLLETKNREFLFDHTSIDKSSYDTPRRSIYVPVIRNHLYDLFQLFDYTDASVLNGNRDTSTIAPQALFWMNSPWVSDLTFAMADRLLAAGGSRRDRIDRMFLQAYGRPATSQETARAEKFLSQFGSLAADQTDKHADRKAWQALCQAVVCSSEFIYLK